MPELKRLPSSRQILVGQKLDDSYNRVADSPPVIEDPLDQAGDIDFFAYSIEPFNSPQTGMVAV
ncbi:hypothetical protein TRIP_B330206 [uncultured Desulfatiglans sp.]|uniref:Uncharacterized protein n=1 Tax=Uncultured Desulfatiglans sp. TaxID=1748965 RepID=A0A653A7U6_UNCDX|nr:hypothetical protein TRIP_B330206 [uncultured Desulfatiglans sp.]